MPTPRRGSLNTVARQRQFDEERRQLVIDNPSIPDADATAYLEQSRNTTEQIVRQAGSELTATGNSVITTPSMPAVPAPSEPRLPAAPPSVPPPPRPPDAPSTPAPPATVPTVSPGATPPASAQAAPSNTNPAATTAQPAAVRDGLVLEFEPNSHNQYDRVSYWFKLSMINDQDAEDADLLNKFLNQGIRQIVIAETGVTAGFNIGDVNIRDAISPSFRNRSSITTEIKFTISEPYGLSLPDKMFAASQQLGIREWRLAPLMLQLEFRYIKNDGTLFTPSGASKLVKVYQVMPISFDAKLTEVGTVYEITAAVKGNLGFSDSFTILPHSYRISTAPGPSAPSAAPTPPATPAPGPSAPPTPGPAANNSRVAVSTGNNRVSDFFTNLGNTVTNLYVQYRRENATAPALPILIYKFVVSPELGEQEIDFSSRNNAGNSNFASGASGSGEILVNRGQSVTALVDDILASLKDSSFFIAPNRLVRIPVIECVSRNVAWDLVLNTYVREFTFFIRVKESNRPVPARNYGEDVQRSGALQVQRMQSLSKNLKKRYDYFYTGLNTEIINVDISFNQLHMIPLPLAHVTTSPQLGAASEVDVSSLNVAEERSRNIREQAGIVSQSESNIQQAAVQSGGDDIARNQSSETSQLTATRLAELRQRQQVIDERLRAIATSSVVPFVDPAVNAAVIATLAPVSNATAAATQFAATLRDIQARNSAQAGLRQFAEDLSSDLEANILRLNYYPDPRDMVNNLARTPVVGVPNTANDTRPLVTTILSQIYDRGSQHLLSVNLEIRGDPYWLGITDLERSKELMQFARQLQTSTDGVPANLGAPQQGGTPGANRAGVVDRYESDANILLRFRAGSAPRVDTGFMNLRDDSTFFYGVYTVIEVNHKFQQGKFTQELSTFRDPLINVDQLRRAEANAGSTTQPTPVASVQPAQVVGSQPITAAAATSSGGASAGGGGSPSPTRGALQTPNSSPSNTARGTQQSERTVSDPSARNFGALDNSAEAIEQRRRDGAVLLRQIDDANRGGGGNGADITGEGGLRDPTSVGSSRSIYLPNNRSTSPFTPEAMNLAPGQSVQFSARDQGVTRADIERVQRQNTER